MNLATQPKTPAHPDLDHLLAYRAGELPEGDALRLQDHLTECRECADLVLEAAVFEDPDTHAPRLSDIERMSVWRTFQKSLPRHRRIPAWAAVAAVLVLAVGLSVWMLQIQSVPAVPGAQSVGPIYDVYPSSRVRSGAREAEPVVFPPGVEQVTVILNPESTETFPRYVAEVEPPEGPILHVQDLYRSPAGGFHLGLSRAGAQEGTVSVQVWGVEDGERVEIDRFELPVYFEP